MNVTSAPSPSLNFSPKSWCRFDNATTTEFVSLSMVPESITTVSTHLIVRQALLRNAKHCCSLDFSMNLVYVLDIGSNLTKISLCNYYIVSNLLALQNHWSSQQFNIWVYVLDILFGRFLTWWIIKSLVVLMTGNHESVAWNYEQCNKRSLFPIYQICSAAIVKERFETPPHFHFILEPI